MKKSFIGAALAIAIVTSVGTATQTRADEQTPTGGAALAAGTTHIDFYRNNTAHTGYTSDKITPPLSLLWRHTTTAIKGSLASPVYADSTIYFGAGPSVYALNAADGTVAWQFPENGKGTSSFGGTPALANGYLYIGSDDGQLFKLDAKTGKQIWAFRAGGVLRTAPIVDKGVVYVGSGDDNCYALHEDSGRPVWQRALGGPVVSSPTLSGSQVTVACGDNTIYSLNTANGKIVWAKLLPSDPTNAPPIYAENSLYVGSGSSLLSLASRTGGRRWERRLPSDVTTPATLGVGSIYVGTLDDTIVALSDRGRLRWSAKIDYPTYAAPLLAGNLLLVPTQHGVIYGFDADKGTLKWEYVAQSGATSTQAKTQFTDIKSAPIYADGTLYVLSDDGSLSALRADAVDTVPPVVSQQQPAPGSTVPGVRVPYSAQIVDEGTGINPATVTLSIDGNLLQNAKYDPSKNAVVLDNSTDAVTQLADGPHQVAVTAADWRGNTVTEHWGFTVDNRFNPTGTTTVAPQPMTRGAGPAATTPSPTTGTNNGSTNGRRRRRNNSGGSAGAPPPPPAPPI